MLAAGLATLAGCRPREVAPSPPIAVQVAALRPETIRAETRFSATVRERQRIELSFKIPGTVQSLLQVPGLDGKWRDVHEGDTVTSDPRHPLARLDDSDYRRQLSGAEERLAQVQAQEHAATAGAIAARATFDRIKSLVERDSVSRQTYDETLAKRDSAEAQLDAAQRLVRAAGVALRQAEDDFKNCNLLSPIPQAIVSRKNVEGGERVPAGQPVLEVMDLSQVRIAFGVPDTKVGQFAIGQSIDVTADALPSKLFAGQITKIVPAADLKTRTFEVELTITEPKGLKPGMVVTILVGPRVSVVLLPMTAVHRGGGKDDCFVYTVVQEDGRQVARRRRVVLDGVYDNRLRVVEGSPSEVRAGDVIVVTGSFRLTEGQAVRVLDVQEPKLRIGT
jgi:RND family efflux transporter MFP subunit